ncbi:DUF421 domain-containing protein [Paenibacillus humicola]|uniref:DUF421 domain-containing protein n=1 Tax=Paenibacillus humicola TaxID=3110540 RepID=UPI00237C376B|nr:YetF domain-containing protein [Paenibacillus humicola]
MWSIIWSSILLACVGTLFLRISGRKSISQMTAQQFVILLSIGTVIGTEVSGKGMAKTILALGTFIVFLIAVEWVTLHWNRAETILKGKAVPIIQEGKLVIQNLRKLRMSVDDLEKRLRIAGISRIEDVESGTIESNGDLGYDLYSDAKPLTKGDLEKLLKAYFPQIKTQSAPDKESIFSEVETNSHPDKVLEQLQ